MHPIYRWGGSYPYHANPMHYAPNHDPRAKEISSHMKMDPSTLSSPYQPWPYGGNHCYPGPQECHDGYNHGYFGGPYSFQPPYPYYPPPPSPSPSYHTHGFYPPFPGAYPAYSFPPPHYSVEQPRYDYDKNAHGSHHCCGCNNHQEDEKKSKIEQEEPKMKTSDSLIPFLLKDYPYPIMWVPPGFMNTESKTKEIEKHSHDPVPLEPLEPSKQDQQGGNDNSLPFPIFWFPAKNNEVGENNVDLVAHKGSSVSRSDDMKINNEAESKMGSKPAVQKVIPVKQLLGTEEQKKIPKSMETKVKSGSVEKTDNGMEGKASPNTSKLPPVCLRVDPLPRKKNSSRSPSPPGDKERSKGSPIHNSKSSEQQTQLTEGLKKGKEEQSEGDIKTIKTVKSDSLADPCENVQSGEKNGSEKDIVCKAEKKKLSENEAALIIQSAFRGFQVRKSKPITKLRQIREVGKQVIVLRNRIHIDEKQKLIIGETIMSLLLKLDTIQGLHPVVREVRKWVAKELVGLQEKLDSVKSETPTEVKHPEDDDGFKVLVESRDAENLELQKEEERSGEVNKNEVEVSVETKQPVDDDDDDVIQDNKVVADDMEQKVVDAMEGDNIEIVESNNIREGVEASDMNLEPQRREEKHCEVEVEEGVDDDDDVIQDKKAGVDDMEQKVVEAMEAENIEVLESDTKEGAEACRDCEVEEVEEGGMVDDVKVMEEVVKEQMGVIRELTQRVKDLEKKLSKNNMKIQKINKKKKKKKNKGRRFHGCIVEEELT